MHGLLVSVQTSQAYEVVLQYGLVTPQSLLLAQVEGKLPQLPSFKHTLGLAHTVGSN